MYCPKYCINVNEDVDVVCVSDQTAGKVFDMIDQASEDADSATTEAIIRSNFELKRAAISDTLLGFTRLDSFSQHVVL